MWECCLIFLAYHLPSPPLPSPHQTTRLLIFSLFELVRPRSFQCRAVFVGLRGGAGPTFLLSSPLLSSPLLWDFKLWAGQAGARDDSPVQCHTARPDVYQAWPDCWPCFVISTFNCTDHYHYLLLKNCQISGVAVSHTERTLNSWCWLLHFLIGKSESRISTHLHRILDGKDFLFTICQGTIRKTWQREVGCITAKFALCWCRCAAVY